MSSTMSRGGRGDPAMAPLMAEAGVPWVLMHWCPIRPGPAARRAHYGDVVADVRRDLLASVDLAVAAGVDSANLVIDPGLGFAKTANWLALLSALPEFVATGIPVLVGASRCVLGALLAARTAVRGAGGRRWLPR